MLYHCGVISRGDEDEGRRFMGIGQCFGKQTARYRTSALCIASQYASEIVASSSTARYYEENSTIFQFREEVHHTYTIAIILLSCIVY